MNTFLGNLDVRLIRDDALEEWMTLAPFGYQNEDLTINVPAGFVTDFMSVPRIPLVYDILGNRGKRLGVIHDWTYKQALFPRRMCDDLLLEMGELCGFSRHEIWEVYVAVRMCGGPHYGKE
jgi:hypothetical protein